MMPEITTAPDPTIPPVPFSPTLNYGWICPRCGRVHAPFVSECTCAPPTVTSTNFNFPPSNIRIPEDYYDNV